MPNITTAATFDKDTQGLSMLRATPGVRYLCFSGSSTGTSTTVQFTDDAGTDAVIPNGTISSLPTFLEVKPGIDLKIVTTGTPNFNVTVCR